MHVNGCRTTWIAARFAVRTWEWRRRKRQQPSGKPRWNDAPAASTREANERFMYTVLTSARAMWCCVGSHQQRHGAVRQQQRLQSCRGNIQVAATKNHIEFARNIRHGLHNAHDRAVKAHRVCRANSKCATSAAWLLGDEAAAGQAAASDGDDETVCVDKSSPALVDSFALAVASASAASIFCFFTTDAAAAPLAPALVSGCARAASAASRFFFAALMQLSCEYFRSLLPAGYSLKGARSLRQGKGQRPHGRCCAITASSASLEIRGSGDC